MITIDGNTYYTSKDVSFKTGKTVNAVNKLAVRYNIGIQIEKIRIYSERDLSFFLSVKRGRKLEKEPS